MLFRVRFKRSSSALSAVALLAVLALAGCGSSAPTKSQYLAKANAICASTSTQTAPLIHQVTAAAAGLAPGAGAAREVATLAGAMQRLHAVATSSLTKLQKLEQPSGAHAAIERFLKPFAAVVSAIEQAAGALQKGQPQQALGMLEQVRPTSVQASSGAQAYGLTQCTTVLAALG